MSQRNIRVNELLKREISGILHTRYQEESVRITITEVNVAPDHRRAEVFFTVIGDKTDARRALSWLQKNKKEIRHYVGRNIVLKYLPHLRFQYDPSIERGNDLLRLMDEIAETEEPGDKPPE